MFEDNSYEPIAEIYLTLSGQPSIDDIYCLCSRVFVEGSNCKEEEVVEIDQNEEEGLEGELVKSANSLESTVRFCNSSFESHHVHTPKKTHEEAVSCYCSASHYSTDEHDSLRDVSGLHHSDSGADLSESSRDHDWEKYWTLNGERLIWESWISKYGSYIDPNYLSSNGIDVNQQPAEGEEASFCVQNEKSADPHRKTSFSGLLDGIKASESRQNSEEKKEDAPKILVESVKSEGLARRFSDISDTGKSLSGRSEDSNFEDDRLRLSVFSRCSGSSNPLSVTTDSMTNVTRITLSSSDSSYGVDDSSAKSSSVLSSSDSGSSVDQQWQNLWTEHFNEQYFYHYSKFTERLVKKRSGEEVKSDCGLILEDTKAAGFQPQHQESVEEVGSIETQDSASQESDQSKPPSVTESNKSSSKCKKSRNRKFTQKEKLTSVGYILQQLHAMSVEHTEQIQEEDESNSLSKPSTVENAQNGNEKAQENAERREVSSDKNERTKVGDGEKCECDDGLSDSSGNIEENADDMENCEEQVENIDMGEPSERNEELAGVRHGVKRTHERENDESVEKIKSAYQLMGLMYDLESTKKIRKASVWYKKRFSQIRFQNRILRLQKPVNKHIYFDDDDDVFNDQNKNATRDEIKDKNDSTELFEDAFEAPVPTQEDFTEPRKLEMEDFSEKDDSTDDDQEIYFSAEEENVLETSQERRDKFKAATKRKKKRQSKKKSVNYPEEMIANPKIKKFWRRRYSLFSKFDEGIKMDVESWYSVTPEKISVNIAERCQCDLVVDGFCGAGGNAIQLAFTCERVIAIDIDPHKIELARHNARVYGVEDRIEFIVGDYFQVAPSLVADVVFLSPPWGGVGYTRQEVFPLSSLQPLSGQHLYEVTSRITENIAFYLPKNVNTQELVECAGPGGSVEVVQNFLDRELIAVTAYFGELVHSVDEQLS